MIGYEVDDMSGYAKPTFTPTRRVEDASMPSITNVHYSRLNSVAENKYYTEYLKICAFYNKMFPNLRHSDISLTKYNSKPFTAFDQERTDTGTGVSCNYLKQIIDQVVSRIGTLTFTPHLASEAPTLDFLIYKDEAERVIRRHINKSDFERRCLECFHDAAIVGYSHVFINPVTHEFVKAQDFEIGMYESQFNSGKVRQLLYKTYQFPVSELTLYTEDAEFLSSLSGVESVTFAMLFDCDEHKMYVMVNNSVIQELPYEHEYVLAATLVWDVGLINTSTTSLFDLLYPIQREINKINAKIQQLIRMYKGPTPVFNSDVDLKMKNISNASGEVLYVDSSRPIDTLMSVINPTPLDSALGAEIETRKNQMYELAGIRQMNFDMNNMRSAAAVVALDQMRDDIFQAQMQAYTAFIAKCLRLLCYDMSICDEDMDAIACLIASCNVNLEPVHLNDPMSDDSAKNQPPTPDFISMENARLAKQIACGEMTFLDIPYWVDSEQAVLVVADLLLRMDAVGIEPPMSLHLFMVDAFIHDVKEGLVKL